jgi:hypothetical protein
VSLVELTDWINVLFVLRAAHDSDIGLKVTCQEREVRLRTGKPKGGAFDCVSSVDNSNRR